MPVVTFGENTGDDVTGVTEDSYIDSGSAGNDNFGSAASIVVKHNSSNRVGLLRWDISAIPAGATINDAQVDVWLNNVSGGTTTIFAYRCLRAWVELEATYDIHSTGNNWNTAGCKGDGSDIDGTAGSATGSLASFDTSGATGTQKFMGSLGSAVAAQLASGAFNLVLHQSSSTNGFISLHSSEGTDGFRPVLTVDYTAGDTYDQTLSQGAEADAGFAGDLTANAAQTVTAEADAAFAATASFGPTLAAAATAVAAFASAVTPFAWTAAPGGSASWSDAEPDTATWADADPASPDWTEH